MNRTLISLPLLSHWSRVVLVPRLTVDHDFDRSTVAVTRRLERLFRLLEVKVMRYHSFNPVHLSTRDQFQCRRVTAITIIITIFLH